jgi:hypothetical protein
VRRTGQIDRGCVKTSARFHTSLFRSLLRGLRAFRVEKIAKNLALLDRLKIFAEFYAASIDPAQSLDRPNMTAICALRTAGVDVKRPLLVARVDVAIGRIARLQRSPGKARFLPLCSHCKPA